MMKSTVIIVLVVVLALVVDQGDCWWGRRRRRSSGRGSWGINNGGVTYTTKSGVKITGYGTIKPKSVGVKVTIPFGRKRRSVEEEEVTPPTPIPDETINDEDVDDEDEGDEVQEVEPTTTTTTTNSTATSMPSEPLQQMVKNEEMRNACEECLEVQPFDLQDKEIENKTIADNDFVMVVKFIEENKSAAKLEAKIKFEVIDVVKSPISSITKGETFTINAQMASCPCLKSIEPGYYVVTGSMDEQNRLVLSNSLLEFEE
eukprot:gene20224-22200_t